MKLGGTMSSQHDEPRQFTGFLVRTPKDIKAALYEGFLLPEEVRTQLLESAKGILQEAHEQEDVGATIQAAKQKKNQEVLENIAQQRKDLEEEIVAESKKVQDIQPLKELEKEQAATRERFNAWAEGELKKLEEPKTGILHNVGDKKVYINNQAEVFAIGPQLGEPGFSGVVYLTQNCRTGRWSCMKQLLSKESEEQGTLRIEGAQEAAQFEAIELEILQREGAFGFHESPLNGAQVLNMHLVHGKDLNDFLNKQNAPLSFEQALAMNISVVEAYESLQRNGYVHRDIKLENIIYDNEQRQCFAIDFGSVKEKGQELTKLEGTPSYMTLEAIQGKPANIADDIYAMGLVAGQILSHSLPPVVISTQEEFDDMTTKLENMDFERRNYLDLITQTFEKQGLLKDSYACWQTHQRVWNVVLGAKDDNYRQQLSQEKRELCKMLYDMTGPPETSGLAPEKLRPEKLVDILQSMRKIRENHIETRVKVFSSKNSYDENLKILYATRELLINTFSVFLTKPGDANLSSPELETLKEERQKQREALRNTSHVLDALDKFLLRCVDEKSENRPTAEEISRELKQYRYLIAQKTSVVQAVQLATQAQMEVKGAVERHPNLEPPSRPVIMTTHSKSTPVPTPESSAQFQAQSGISKTPPERESVKTLKEKYEEPSKKEAEAVQQHVPVKKTAVQALRTQYEARIKEEAEQAARMQKKPPSRPR